MSSGTNQPDEVAAPYGTGPAQGRDARSSGSAPTTCAR